MRHLGGYENKLEENASDIKSILEKRARFLKENAEELAIIPQRRVGLINDKSYCQTEKMNLIED
jgi:hypothetical protein